VSRILVTPRSLTAEPGERLAALTRAGFELVCSPAGRQPSEAELIALVPGCVGWLAGVEPIGPRVLEAATDLKVISRNGTGIDSIDLEAAQAHGIKIMTAPGANASAVAELTLAFVICGLRRIPASAAALKKGEWRRERGREIGGSTIGLVGCGAVGRAVAEAMHALGASVLAVDPEPRPELRPLPRFAWTSLADLVSRSDVVSLPCPALPHAAPVLDAVSLAAMKPGAGLVNTARASLVDEDALLHALDSGRIGWYATDVFAVEPPPPSRLFAHERVLATPHIGGFTAEGGERAIRVAVENLLAELATPAPAQRVAAR
jgi:phosphoglycerate dehydrogenase-like enzyme